MTPPLVAALPAFWYGWRHGARVALDAHSAAFLHPRWRRWQWFQRMLCRRAETTLVHNEHIAAEVRRAGGHAILVPDVPIEYGVQTTFPRTAEFTVAVVCSFNYDEPIPAILDAAAMLPDVRFFITGNPRDLKQSYASRLPANAQLTGFLDTDMYGALLRTADVVLTLTTRDHTMLRGAYEAIYQGTPVIVSNWPVLQAGFDDAGLYVDNTATDIVAAVRRMQSELTVFREAAMRARGSKLARWKCTRGAILERLRSAVPARSRRSD